MTEPVQRISLTPGLLAISPFFVLVDSLLLGLTVGILVFLVLIFNIALLPGLRNLFPATLRLPVILIVNATLALVFTHLLQSGAYSLYSGLGILLPLLMINSLVCGLGEQLFATSDRSRLIKETLIPGLLLVLVLTIYGAAREFLIGFVLLSDLAMFAPGHDTWSSNNHAGYGLPVFSMPAGVFFLVAILFACINMIGNGKRDLSDEQEPV